jgi:hypothetical protein
VREIAEQIGRDLAAEYMKAVAPGGCAHNRGL